MSTEQEPKVFNVYTGDGNFGTSFDRQIEATDLDDAIRIYLEPVAPAVRELFEIDGDEDFVDLTIYEMDGRRAYNGGAYFCATIHGATTDPRR